jgi:hypothetical protein
MAVALNANALITAVELETILQITIASDLKNTLINIASDFIGRYCENKFLPLTTYTNEAYDGNGTNIMYLKNKPIVSVTAVKVWDTYNDESSDTLVEHDDYTVNIVDGYIYKRSPWSRGEQNYKITYQAGYTSNATAPYDLKYACAMLASLVHTQRGKSGIASESMGKYSVSYDKSSALTIYGMAVPAEILGMLNMYKHYTEF